ncbi:MAG: 50S ribosomal protein L24 [Candidatus Andersenbacteria bacterium]
MLKIMQNDTVLVSAGKYRGKKGKVTQVFAEEKLVVVEGVNKIYRHIKPQRKGESGQRIELTGPISIANVALLCPSCGKPTRVGFETQGTGEQAKKIRICRKCKKPIVQKAAATKKAPAQKAKKN